MVLKTTFTDGEAHHGLPLYRVWMCGAFRLERLVGNIYVGLDTKEWGGHSSPRTVLKLLLCAPRRRASRGTLLLLCWPDADGMQANRDLNVAISRLRKILGSCLSTEEDAAGFSVADQSIIWVDADAALAHITEAERLPEAEALPFLENAQRYFQRGAFLEPDEGEWAESRRAIVERQRYRCWLWLAQTRAQQGNPAQAEALLQELVSEDPTDEDALCRLMSLLHQQGLTHQALVLYKRTRTLLAEEGLALSSSVKRLAIQLREERLLTTLVLDAGQIPVVQSEQGSNEKAYLTPSLQPTLLGEWASLERALWFALRVNNVKEQAQESATTCQERQDLVHTEIRQWSTMSDQDHEYQISRRMALATLATLSTSLLAKIQTRPLTALVLQDFLAQCSTSLAASWHLLQGRELTLVQQTLTRYLPLLRTLGKHPSAYQSSVAYLASQGCLLHGLLALHVLPQPQNVHQRLLDCTQAASFALLSKDPNLRIVALTHLANAQYDMRQYETMLHTYQQAASLVQELSHQHQFPAFLQSKLQVELAHAYAQQGNAPESLWALQAARTFFSSEDKQLELPVFLSTDYGHHSLMLFEGMTHLDLESIEPEKGHAHQAVEALARVESVPESIPDRFRIEIINQQGLAAIKDGDLDHFCHYFQEGLQGAQALASEKRRQEAIANWKEARRKWPDEPQILELADLLF